MPQPFLYHSTRGQAPDLDFMGVTMTGLAPDGGLYIPKIWPQFSQTDIRAMAGKPYIDVALTVIRPFVAGCLDDAQLRTLLTRAYQTFRDGAVTPLRPLDTGRWILELFHGPTLAFKDVALQLLGHLFEHFLDQTHDHMTVLGATSGDTGSAAMMALAGRKNIETFILYPLGRPSDIQRKQMTCIDSANVHAIEIKGSFDDGQAIVKSFFNDPALRTRYHLAAINSINWARVMAQIVYYFYAAAQLGAPDIKPTFVVPTGNFGNVYAAYAAHKCGLPIERLVVASNANDILPRFFTSGEMKVGTVVETISPSMDIQISSNFERLLFDLCDADSAALRRLMQDLKTTGHFTVTPAMVNAAGTLFSAVAVSDDETIKTIQSTYAATQMILDPHSAIGVAAANRLKESLKTPVVSLACAAPAKFPYVIEKSININPSPPDFISELLRKPERKAIVPATTEAISAYMSEQLGG